MTEDRRAMLQVAAGASFSRLVESALEQACQNCVIASAAILSVQPNDVAPLIRSRLNKSGTSVSEIVTRSMMPRRGSGMTTIDVSARAGRIDHVGIPKAFFEVDRVFVVNDLRSFISGRSPIAIGAWAGVADSKNRFGSALSGFARERESLASEIALAAPPAFYLLVGEWARQLLVIATDDIVAAEIAGLAFGSVQGDPGLDQRGPWESSLVQRATELGLGVTGPREIEYSANLGIDLDQDSAAEFHRFVTRLGELIGIEELPNLGRF